MTQAQWQQLNPIISGCCTDLFSACGITLILEPASAPLLMAEESAVAFICFAGAQIHGHMLVGSTLTLLRRSYPLESNGAPRSDSELRDWLRELTNQLLGRIKGRLLAEGLSFEISCPTCLMGGQLRADAGERLLFRAPTTAFWVQFEAAISPAFTFTGAAPVLQQAREGEMMLFDERDVL